MYTHSGGSPVASALELSSDKLSVLYGLVHSNPIATDWQIVQLFKSINFFAEEFADSSILLIFFSAFTFS